MYVPGIGHSNDGYPHNRHFEEQFDRYHRRRFSSQDMCDKMYRSFHPRSK